MGDDDVVEGSVALAEAGEADADDHAEGERRGRRECSRKWILWICCRVGGGTIGAEIRGRLAGSRAAFGREGMT